MSKARATFPRSSPMESSTVPRWRMSHAYSVSCPVGQVGLLHNGKGIARGHQPAGGAPQGQGGRGEYGSGGVRQRGLALSLKQPAVAFSTLVLPVIKLDAAKVVRISRHNSGEPYFRKPGLNRFDDSRGHLPRADRYGTCYFVFTLACAFAETVLQDRTPMATALSCHTRSLTGGLRDISLES
jgi:hypothetical protein